MPISGSRERAYSSSMSDLSVAERRIIRTHCDWFALDSTEQSIQARRDNLIRLARDLDPELLAATADDLADWQSSLRTRVSERTGRALSVNTLATYSAHCKAFYRWAADTDRIEVDPSTRLRRIHRPRGEAHPIPERDLLHILDIAPEPMRTWLLLAAFMGLRAMEIAHLRRENVQEVEGRLVISAIGKYRKPFRLTVPLHVEPSIRLHLARAGRLWTAPRGGPLTPANLSLLVARLFHRNDMPYTLHWLRHSFGTETYRRTRDLLLTQDVMRHSSADMTRIYVQTTAQAGVKAMDQVAARALRPRRRSTRRAGDQAA